mmetsp:Transcript_38032/g.95607  ORF Transcript_38032/g.95607 Transcript_38032/m.95607 type:complete len:243 (-) Transcript_38032:741-1469(-)
MPNAIRVAVHASSTVNATYVRIALRATFSTWISCSVVDCGSSFGPTPSPPPPGGSSWTASSCFAASNDNGYCTIYCGSDSSNGACYDLRNNNEYACDNAVEFCQSLGEPTGDVECVPQYCAVCGNGLCEQSERCSSCTVDCCPGELNCDDATDCEECAQMTDCGWCGTFCIAGGEPQCDDWITSSAQCPSAGEFCGDGNCDSTETCSNCPSDCGSCSPPPSSSGGGGGGTSCFPQWSTPLVQ